MKRSINYNAKQNKHSTLERIIILAFPVALFAGCAGSGDMKTAKSEASFNFAPEVTHPESVDTMEDISLAYTMTDPTPVETMDTPIESESTIETVESTIEQEATEVMETTTSTVILPVTNIYYFETDKYDLADVDQEQIKQHAGYLIANPEMTLEINGHADVRGTDKYNLDLSEKRANTILEALIALGVPEHQVTVNGHGELQPLNNEHAWDENRRVELDYLNPVMVSEK